MTITTTKPRTIAAGLPDLGVYVACLASYNAGRLHGAWVDLGECHDVEDIQEAIAWVLSTSPAPDAEEWAMHDSAGLPAYLSRTEWPDLGDLIEWADGVADFASDEDRIEAYRLECENQGKTLDSDEFSEAYRGCFKSEEDYAMELAEELDVFPQPTPWPLGCIDWEAAWRELTFDGYRSERCSSGGVHIFCNV